jgi:lysophospholipase L1-like esterase
MSLADIQAMKALKLVKQLQTKVNSTTIKLQGNSIDVPASVAPSVKISTDTATNITLGAMGKNLIPIDANGGTVSGITFTVNNDKSITISGTATADFSFTCTTILKKYIKRYIGKHLKIYVNVQGTVSGSLSLVPSFATQNLINTTLTSNALCSSPDIPYQEKSGSDGLYFWVTNGSTINATVFISMQENIGTSNLYETFTITELPVTPNKEIIMASDSLASKTLFVEDNTTNSITLSYNKVQTYTDADVKNVINVYNPLWGKTSLFCGDSITYGAGWRPTPEDYLNTGWARIIRDNNNMTMGSYGAGGTTIAKRAGVTNSILERISTMPTSADYIILQGGVNDVWNSVPLGTISSGYSAILDETTFCGAMESMLKQAILKWQGKKIGFILTHRIKTAEPSLGNFMEQARQICVKWSIPYLNLHDQSGICGDIDTINNTYFQLSMLSFFCI